MADAAPRPAEPVPTEGEHRVGEHGFRVLTDGPDRLDALMALIDGAQRQLQLLFYIFADDDAGRRVRDAMVAACERGVAVSLIVDAFGSGMSGDAPLLAPLRAAGCRVCAFEPRWGRRYLMRNHQKLAIADGARAMMGGFNVADAYFAPAGDAEGWRDLGVVVTGPAVSQLAGYFDALQTWTRRPRARMRDLRRALQRWSNPHGDVRWLHGGPLRRLSPWLRMVRQDLRSAHDLSLVAAYFAPTADLTRLIDRIGRRGSARVVTAAHTDNMATVGAARFVFTGLLRKGVRVFEYQPMRLHTKLYVIDDVVHLGSANFDPRSLFLNLELMLRVHDRPFADAMRRYVDGEVAQSVERRLPEFQGWASLPGRARNALCYFLVGVLDPSVTRRLNLGVD